MLCYCQYVKTPGHHFWVLKCVSFQFFLGWFPKNRASLFSRCDLPICPTFPKSKLPIIFLPHFPATATNLWCWPQICWNNQQEGVDNGWEGSSDRGNSELSYFSFNKKIFSIKILVEEIQNIFEFRLLLLTRSVKSEICENCDRSRMTPYQDFKSAVSRFQPHDQIVSSSGRSHTPLHPHPSHSLGNLIQHTKFHSKNPQSF